MFNLLKLNVMSSYRTPLTLFLDKSEGFLISEKGQVQFRFPKLYNRYTLWGIKFVQSKSLSCLSRSFPCLSTNFSLQSLYPRVYNPRHRSHSLYHHIPPTNTKKALQLSIKRATGLNHINVLLLCRYGSLRV